MSKQAEKTASAMAVAAGSLMDMIEFTKALTQYDSVPEVPQIDSIEDGIGMRPVKSTFSCFCVCHPEDADGHDIDHDGSVCRCKAPSHATFKKPKKMPGLDQEETLIITESTRSSASAGEEPIIVVAHPPEPQKGPIALYPGHECSAQCHCYLRHIQQGPPLENYPAAIKESHEAKPKKCVDQCRCSCHKEPAKIIECTHQCSLHCEPEPEPEKGEDSEESKVETDATDPDPIAETEAAKPRNSVIGSITKLGSMLKPTSMAKGSTSDGVSPDEAKSPKPSKMSESKRVSLESPTEEGGNKPAEGRSSRSSGKGSILSRLSNGLRRSK